ncbi:MAG: acyl-CoA dehydrogenase family protein [Streptosporangiales bacterium]|nr:acyl-CoA dehydrogenase family protein [Streptosporangiales bacterium]
MRAHHFTPEQDEYRAAFREFLERELVPRQPAFDEAGIVDKELWRLAGKHNFLLPWADEQYGGLGLTDIRYEQVMTEELCRVYDSGFGLSLHSAIVAPYLDAYGTPEQKRRFLPPAVSGETILAIAITEPEAGSDVAGIRTTAVEHEDYWVLNGAKSFVSNGINADLFVVAAYTDPEQSHTLGLFLVESDTPGFSRGRKLDKMGLRAQDTAELFFDDAIVPKANMLGDRRDGFKAMMSMFAQERLVVAMVCAAGAMSALDTTVAYAKERKAFGRSIGQFQNTRFVLASLRTKVDAMHALVDRCTMAHVAGELTPQDAAEAKLFASEVLGEVVDECVQVFGGYGYMREYPIARMYVDARVQRIYAGTSEIMREIIGRSMEL